MVSDAREKKNAKDAVSTWQREMNLKSRIVGSSERGDPTKRRRNELWDLLDVAFAALAVEHLAYARERETAGREVDGYQPGGDGIDKVVETICVRHAVDVGVDGEEKEERIGHIA